MELKKYNIEDIIKRLEKKGILLLDFEKDKLRKEFKDFKSSYYRDYMQDVIDFLF